MILMKDNKILREGGIIVAEKTAGYGLFGGCGNVFFNQAFFETLLMIIIIMWLLRWLFGFGYGYGV
ncbi:MAG: hypothetical protein ACOYVD_02675 [Bacillota bacterium]